MEQQRAQPPQTLQQNAVERAPSLLQNMQQHPVWSAIIILLVIALVVSFIGGYFFNLDWTGFGPYSPSSKDSNFQRGKTIWDWLQLLIVPVMLAIPTRCATR